ncbi:MAG TPA: hypothetical protein VN541_13535, partial [Tepidisphaeraceae bacterium]|nr:hypothetical protein [Tepidisphaeraceae bacterium]
SITTDGAFGAINAPVANVIGAITLPGGAKTISLLSANGGTMTIGGGPSPAINLTQIGNETINSAVPIRSIQVAMDAGVNLTAPSVGTFLVAGSLIDSTLDLTAPTAARVFDLRTLSVGRGIIDTTIHSAGNVAKISAQDMSGSTIFAGVASLPASQGLPAAPGDFASAATIASIVLARSSAQPSFSNSNIAAFNLGNLQLGNILMNNAGAHFGVAGHQVGTVVGTDLATRRSFTIKNATSAVATAAALQARGINPQDFEIILV